MEKNIHAPKDVVKIKHIILPNGAKNIIDILQKAQFEAYVVGGCVRDSLLGLEPHDWDICTNATPSEIMTCFSDKRIIKTGLKHGTVTILTDDGGYEVTTFRIDGNYSDNRHPNYVEFTSSLKNDLSRRDFTINAMAYNDETGLIDPFDGETALRQKEIACVGDPSHRFQEDALRVMRALRFASTYNFRINPETSDAIHAHATNLKNIAAERIQSELCKLLLGHGVLDVLLQYSDVIAAIIPEIKPCIGFNQNNPYHQYTIYDHIAHAVANYTGDDIAVKTALLLHDIGKPYCCTEDERGYHFHGHGIPSHDITRVVTRRLRFDNKTRHNISTLVLYHDAIIEPTPKTIRRWLNKIGEKQLRQLLLVRMADIKAHAENTQDSRIERCNAIRTVLDDVIAQEQCFSIKNLAINGRDILALGAPEGKIIGDILKHILNMVINGNIPNEPEIQKDIAKQYLSTHI